jgi:hypothetical protein
MTNENKVTYDAVLKDGNKVRITKDATHYRAHNAAGVQVGQPFVALGSLLDAIGGRLPGEQGPAAQVQEPKAEGTGKPVEVRAGEAELPGGEKLAITHDKYHYRAYRHYGTAKAERVGGEYTSVNTLLTELKAVAAFVAPAPQPAPAAPLNRNVPPADVTQCGQHQDGQCEMDHTKCDGHCGEHAARAQAADKSVAGAGNQPDPAATKDNEPAGQADEKNKDNPGGILGALGLRKNK